MSRNFPGKTMATIASTLPLRLLKVVEFAFAGPRFCSPPKYFECSQFSHRKHNMALTTKRNASVLPKIRAQNSVGYFPDSNFYKVEAILRPWRIPQVSSALLKMGIRGVTISDCKGFGAQGASKERQGGSEFYEGNFVAKVKMEIVVSKNQVEAVVDTIIEVARTGEIGDGKIFLTPVADVVRVRTGERGEKAERMSGGRADMISVL